MPIPHRPPSEEKSVFVHTKHVASLLLVRCGRIALSTLLGLKSFAKQLKQFLFSNSMQIEYGRPTDNKSPFTWFRRVGWLLVFWLGGVVVVSCTAELLKKIIFSGIH
nr:hypothetical protein [uncultured Neokomagataea sp.]